MASPFALAVGGYLLIFLSIYTTSCSLYLHVAKATVRWFALGDFALLTTSASTTTVAMADLPPMTIIRLIRLIWDPGIASCAIDRRVWDPGVHHRSVGHNTTMMDPISIAPLNRSMRPPLRAHAFVDGAALTDDRDLFLCVQRELVADSNVIVTMIPTTTSMDSVERSALRPTRPMVSMFQCCHPVLSRPTVPNII